LKTDGELQVVQPVYWRAVAIPYCGVHQMERDGPLIPFAERENRVRQGTVARPTAAIVPIVHPSALGLAVHAGQGDVNPTDLAVSLSARTGSAGVTDVEERAEFVPLSLFAKMVNVLPESPSAVMGT
jgi:hypothetical protein